MGTFNAYEIRQMLIQGGSAVAVDNKGKRIFIIASYVIAHDVPGLLITYEGKGSYYYTKGEKISPLKLLTNGFPPMLCGSLSKLLTEVVHDGYRSTDHEGNVLKALAAPIKTRKSRKKRKVN